MELNAGARRRNCGRLRGPGGGRGGAGNWERIPEVNCGCEGVQSWEGVNYDAWAHFAQLEGVNRGGKAGE